MTVRIISGHVLEILATLPDASVHGVVTSPPYYALRAYGTEPQIWAITAEQRSCDHEWQDLGFVRKGGNGQNKGLTNPVDSGYRAARGDASQTLGRGSFCVLCGAWKGELGQEPSIARYLDHLLAVFDEIRRVLRPDGTCWVNLGDGYASGASAGTQGATGQRADRTFTASGLPARGLADGLKPKDLMLVPHRFVIAMQERGWWVRSDIIWAKKACLPESVTDRPTSAHEHVFLFTKRDRYFYDADAVREPLAESSITRLSQPAFDQQTGGDKDYGSTGENANRSARQTVNNLHEKFIRQEKWASRHEGWAERDKTIGANLRNVWHLGPEPFPEAHFATFVSEVPRRAIKAGTSEAGCCATCGAPWRRQTAVAYNNPGNRMTNGPRSLDQRHETAGFPVRLEKITSTLGWQPSCDHAGDPIPCTVLDPFGGSGTTGMVADELGRDAILIDLKPEYVAMSARRVRNAAPLFADVQVIE